MKRWRIGLLVLACSAGSALASLSFAPIFNDGAVLQCEMPVNVWGQADPDRKVEILLDGQKIAETVANVAGNWKAVISAQAAGGAHVIQTLAGGESVKISDVWFGEVWLASGQSNMCRPLSTATGGDEWLKKDLPEIRFVYVPLRTGLPVEKELTHQELAWKSFRPGTNGKLAAVAFYFAEQIQEKTGRKVGLIQSSYGATPCEAWTPEWALDAKPELKYLADEIRKGLASGKTKDEWMADVTAVRRWYVTFNQWNIRKEGSKPEAPPAPGQDNPWSQESPTVLYENMIAPLVPYTTRGVIWYQGESNAKKPQEYRILFPTMISAWRTVWNRPDWPFFFVQLAAFNHPTFDWAALRDAQTFARDTVPHTGMAVAIDCGEKANIHPGAKQPVGERLARLALDQVYGQQIVSRGPVFQTLEKKDGKVCVIFQTLGNPLKASDGKADVPGFEVAGADGLFHPAQGKIISSDTVELNCGAVQNSVAVRYAWANWIEPPVTLQNSSGLPAEPFMSK